MIGGPHILYRCFDAAGELLYVGITNDADRRFLLHERFTRWWGDVADTKLENFSSRWELEAAEKAAILAEVPLHNVRGNFRWHTKHEPPALSQAMRDAIDWLAGDRMEVS